MLTKGDQAFDYLYYIHRVDNYKRSDLAELPVGAVDDRICSASGHSPTSKLKTAELPVGVADDRICSAIGHSPTSKLKTSDNPITSGDGTLRYLRHSDRN